MLDPVEQDHIAVGRMFGCQVELTALRRAMDDAAAQGGQSVFLDTRQPGGSALRAAALRRALCRTLYA